MILTHYNACYVIMKLIANKRSLCFFWRSQCSLLLRPCLFMTSMASATIYSTNHPQLKWYMHVTRMCKSKKTCVVSNHTCTFMQNKCTTHMHLFIQSIFHKTTLLTTSSALSFMIIYACRNILGGMVTDILGHQRHTAFIAICS